MTKGPWPPWSDRPREQDRAAVATIDQHLTEAVTTGRYTGHDAQAILTFRDFLRETPHGATRLHNSRAAFDTDEQFNTWRMRWLPYIAGLTNHPTDRQQYTEHLPALRRWWETR